MVKRATSVTMVPHKYKLAEMNELERVGENTVNNAPIFENLMAFLGKNNSEN